MMIRKNKSLVGVAVIAISSMFTIMIIACSRHIIQEEHYFINEIGIAELIEIGMTPNELASKGMES